MNVRAVDHLAGYLTIVAGVDESARGLVLAWWPFRQLLGLSGVPADERTEHVAPGRALALDGGGEGLPFGPGQAEATHRRPLPRHPPSVVRTVPVAVLGGVVHPIG